MNLHSIRERGQMAHEQQLQFRYIAMQQGGWQKRKEWLDQVLPHYETLDFGSHPAILTSQAVSEFDVIIFGGEDLKRLARFIREHGLMLLDKVKMSLCLRSEPAQRARLLSAGFDDVIDVRRVTHAEFLARASAIFQRYKVARQRRLEEHDRFVQLVRACSPLDMSAKQRNILAHFLRSPDGKASFERLKQIASETGEPISHEHLQVLISQIRRHLQPGYRIVSEGGVGYRLIAPGPRPDEAIPVGAPLRLKFCS